MAIVNVTINDTFDEWRIKTNEVGSQLGDVSGTVLNNATTTFTGQNGINANDFVGSAATFTVTNTAGTYSVAVTQAGSGYAVNDTITIKGSNIGGVDTTNDATITVTAVTGGNIDTATITGTSAPQLANEFKLVQDYVDPTQALDTTATNLADAINEHEADIGTMSLTTTATDITDAINELDAEIGSATLTTTAQTVAGAINEHESDIGTMSLTTTASNLTAAVNEVDANADTALSEIGGGTNLRMAADFDGSQTNIIDALNGIYAASSVATLDLEYMRVDGSSEMDVNDALKLSNGGLSVTTATNLVLKTEDSSNVLQDRLTIADSSGNVGIGKAPGTTKVDVQGTVKATGFNENGSTLTSKYSQLSGTNAISAANTFSGSNTFSDSLIVGTTTVASSGLTITEWSQDVVGGMVTGNTETGGISAVYNDSTGKITLAIANNSHSHTTGNITGLTEEIQDVAGGMWSGNSESGVAVTYQDGDGTLDINVNDPTLSVSGDVSGSAVMTNLGNTDIDVTLNTEAVQDAAAPLISNGVHTGLSAAYDDANNRVNLALTADPVINLTGDASGSVTLTNLASSTFNLAVTVADDSHNHVTGNIDNFTESVQDIVGTMVNPTNTESGINVTYNDTSGKLNFDVNDPTITLTGDITGTATMSNLGSVSIATTIATASTLNVYDVNGTRVYP